MEKSDLRTYSVPLRIENTNGYGEMEEGYAITELIYIKNS